MPQFFTQKTWSSLVLVSWRCQPLVFCFELHCDIAFGLTFSVVAAVAPGVADFMFLWLFTAQWHMHVFIFMHFIWCLGSDCGCMMSACVVFENFAFDLTAVSMELCLCCVFKYWFSYNICSWETAGKYEWNERKRFARWEFQFYGNVNLWFLFRTSL